MPVAENNFLPLPIGLEDLLFARTVESIRLEFKKTWDERIEPAVVETVCAFANDLQNLNGGYIVLGVEESGGRPQLPPHGLNDLDLDLVQKQVRGACKRISPDYQPVLFPVEYQGQTLLVIWVPGGDVRPYQAPNHRKGNQPAYFVREGSVTGVASDQTLTNLLQLAARIPFDDRRRQDVPLDEVAGELVRQHLRDVHSDLANAELTTAELLRAMRLTVRTNGHEAPRNAALLFFTHDPERYFPGARIELAQFADDAGGNLIEERTIRGPLPNQILAALAALEGLSSNLVQKVPGQAEATRVVSYPYEATEESLANAILHRSYDQCPEPTKVYLYPDRLEIISYPGPVPGVRQQDLAADSRPTQAPLRNRRVGEFLKELRLAEMRGTGIPKIRRRMRENGSPEPTFEFDEQRTFFRVTLPAHPEYVVLDALRQAAGRWAVGDRQAAIRRLDETRGAAAASGSLLAQLIEYLTAVGDDARADEILDSAMKTPGMRDRHLPLLAMARACLERGDHRKARRLLDAADVELTTPLGQLDRAILYKRNGDLQQAHRVFESAFASLQDNAKAVHEFAQTKIALSKATRGRHAVATRKRLTQEAVELFRRTIQLNEHPTRTAWAWFDLGRALEWLRAPESDVEHAIRTASQLLPNEQRFQDYLENRAARKSGRES